MTGRCQRCGRACAGTLCATCQDAATALQALMKKYPAGTHRYRKPGRRAGPPAVVVETFKAVGSLQLHRLGSRAHFYCVTCRERKKGDLVATTDGDWKRAVCDTCYRALVKQGRTGKAPIRLRRPGQTARQPSKIRPKQLSRPDESPAQQAITGGRQQQFTQQPLWIDSLLEFFNAAGVEAYIGSTGQLWVDGRQVKRLAGLPSWRMAGWPDAANEIALKYVCDKFVRAVEKNARFVETLGASLLPRPKGVAIMRGDERLGVIHPAHASIPHHHFIYGNFLIAGPHWQQVANALRAEVRRTAGHMDGREAARRRRIDQLPDDLAAELIDACLGASRRIRLERRLDYGDTPVILECDVGELTLLPIAGPESRLLLPFRLRKETETVEGELILSNRDPLPVMIGADVADEDAITAWTCALLGFADATCMELDRAGPTARREAVRPRRHPRSKGSRPAPQARIVPSRHHWPSYLEPVGNTAYYIDSLVRGHRRRLRDGWTASNEACDRARRIGIILRADETWVQPHPRGRGLPVGVEMRFLWHAPIELKHIR